MGTDIETKEILSDDYPIYMGYVYVVDGKVIESDITGTVKDFKKDLRSYYKIEALEVCKYKF